MEHISTAARVTVVQPCFIILQAGKRFLFHHGHDSGLSGAVTGSADPSVQSFCPLLVSGVAPEMDWRASQGFAAGSRLRQQCGCCSRQSHSARAEVVPDGGEI